MNIIRKTDYFLVFKSFFCNHLKVIYYRNIYKLIKNILFMPLLEDRLLRIWELKELGKSDIEISEELGLNDGNVSMFVHNKKITSRKMGSRKSEIKRFGFDYENGLRTESLTHRDASQIYAFEDEFNSSREEIAEAIGKSTRLVEYALDNRKEIEPTLIKYLRVLFPEESVSKPYR